MVRAFINWREATIAKDAADSDAIPFGDYAQGGYAIPSSFDGTSMGFKVSADNGASFVGFNNDSGAVVQTVSAGRAYAMPIGMFPFTHFKFSAGSLQATARVIQVSLKY